CAVARAGARTCVEGASPTAPMKKAPPDLRQGQNQLLLAANQAVPQLVYPAVHGIEFVVSQQHACSLSSCALALSSTFKSLSQWKFVLVLAHDSSPFKAPRPIEGRVALWHDG